MKKKVFIVIALSMLLLVGCDIDKTKQEHIKIESKTTNLTDDINIMLEKSWWVKDYLVDYENKQVILNIEREIE